MAWIWRSFTVCNIFWIPKAKVFDLWVHRLALCTIAEKVFDAQKRKGQYLCQNGHIKTKPDAFVLLWCYMQWAFGSCGGCFGVFCTPLRHRTVAEMKIVAICHYFLCRQSCYIVWYELPFGMFRLHLTLKYFTDHLIRVEFSGHRVNAFMIGSGFCQWLF